MSDDTQNLAAVEAILTERDALHGWLVRLDAAGDAAPESVRTKVRQDYEQRLDAVTDRLRGHADTIGARLASDRAEHADLAGRARLSRDALAEAELRHAVGEYDSEQFERERGRHTGDLETYDLSLTAVAERIARLEEVQALVQREPAEGQAPARAPDEAPTAEDAEAPDDDRGDGGEPAREAESAASESREEEEALLAIFEPVEDEEDAGEEDREAPPSPPARDSGPLSFIPSGEVPRATPPRSERAMDLRANDQPPRFVRPSPSRGSELVDSAESRQRTVQQLDVAGIELDPAPILPEPEIAGETGPRTLRCGECGAMNRPLEWYCEKCGAELTAV
jgi:hypothetical protein